MNILKDFIDSLFQIDKIPNKIFFAGIVFCSLYIFEPMSWILPQLPQNWKSFVSVAFSVCLVMFSINVIFWIISKTNNWLKIRSYKKKYKEIYYNVDIFERNVIREFYLRGQNTLLLPYFDPVIQGMVDKSILVNASSFSVGYVLDGMNTSYRLNKYIIPYIQPKKDFDLPKNNSKEEIRRISDTRPIWAR